MSVKSFLSKLKEHSKIAEGDDNMFIEPKPTTFLVPAAFHGICAKVMIYPEVRASESPLSLTRTGQHAYKPAERHPSFPEETLAVWFGLWGPTGVRDGWAMEVDGESTHTHAHRVEMVGIPQQVRSLSWHVQGLGNSLPPPCELTAATVSLPVTNYSVSLSAPSPTPSCSTSSLVFDYTVQNLTLTRCSVHFIFLITSYFILMDGFCRSGVGAAGMRSTSDSVA